MCRTRCRRPVPIRPTSGGSAPIRGFRTGGELILEPDGTLTYTYDEMRGQGRVAAGRGTVHEGDGQRVIVLTKTDGTMTTRVAKSLP